MMDADTQRRIAWERAQVAAAELRLQGTAALSVKAGASKVDVAEHAGISRPTLDKWIERTEAGKTITTDWAEKPGRVTLHGVNVDVRYGQIETPSPLQSTYNLETGWVLTLPAFSAVDTTSSLSDDYGGAIVAPHEGSVAVFSRDLLDTALTLIVSAEVHRRQGAGK